jgi:hypothetical protein
MLDAHRRGLGGMVDSRSGLSKLGLDGLIKETLLQCVSLLCLRYIPISIDH